MNEKKIDKDNWQKTNTLYNELEIRNMRFHEGFVMNNFSVHDSLKVVYYFTIAKLCFLLPHLYINISDIRINAP